MGGALDIELFHRGGDFGRDGCLGDGGEDRVGDGVLGDGLDLGVCGLDWDGCGFGGFFFGAAGEEEESEQEAGSWKVEAKSRKGEALLRG
jgi:hypothetical protein